MGPDLTRFLVLSCPYIYFLFLHYIQNLFSQGEKMPTAFFCVVRSDLVSSEDSRAWDMEAVREVAGQRWQNMTPEEKQQFKTE